MVDGYFFFFKIKKKKKKKNTLIYCSKYDSIAMCLSINHILHFLVVVTAFSRGKK